MLAPTWPQHIDPDHVDLRHRHGLEVFGLMNHSIQNEVVHHGFITQILWDDSIPHINTKQLITRNEVVMD
jgi:alpha-D-ribose 1-methylphosphonate 5-phosphate C-P lyase